MPAGVMTRFVIRELSGVDRPAQAGARAVLMKRAKGAPDSDPIVKRTFTAEDRKRLAASGAAMPSGDFPIETKDDLRNAVEAFGRAKDPEAAKAHIIQRAKDLSATDELPEAWGADDDDEEPDEIKKMIARGAEIRKATEREAPQRAEPSDLIDWKATAAQHAVDFDRMAKARAKEKGVSYFTAYHQCLDEHPDAARRMLMG